MLIKWLTFICLLPGLLITNQKLVWNEVVSTVGTRDFTYDNQRQLTSAARVDGSGNPLATYNYQYNYDLMGNWTKELAPGGELDFSYNKSESVYSDYKLHCSRTPSSAI